MSKNDHKILHQLAHFLLINIDGIHSNGLRGKISLAMFFFQCYRIFKQESYADVAFDLIEQSVFAEFSDNTKENLTFLDGISGIGWSIIEMHKEKLFEAEIAEIVDSLDRPIFRYISHNTYGQTADNTLTTNLEFLPYFVNRVSQKYSEKNWSSLVLQEHFHLLLNGIFETLRDDTVGDSDFYSLIKVKIALDEIIQHKQLNKALRTQVAQLSSMVITCINSLKINRSTLNPYILAHRKHLLGEFSYRLSDSNAEIARFDTGNFSDPNDIFKLYIYYLNISNTRDRLTCSAIFAESHSKKMIKTIYKRLDNLKLSTEIVTNLLISLVEIGLLLQYRSSTLNKKWVDLYWIYRMGEITQI